MNIQNQFSCIHTNAKMKDRLKCPICSMKNDFAQNAIPKIYTTKSNLN
jgi:hypothetical protein